MDAAANRLPTLVFLHFFGGSGGTWRLLAQILQASGWSCLTPDLRGFGGSPVPADSCFSVDEMAGDVEELVRREALDCFVLIGHSMGGKVALALAAGRPAGLLGCVLLAPSPPTAEPIPPAERARLSGSHGDVGAARDTLKKMTARPLPKTLAETTVLDILRSSPDAWRAWLEKGSREDISARLDQIQVPVRIAVGEDDQAITRELVELEICARLTGVDCSSVVLPEAAHLLPLEKPEAIAGVIVRAVKQFNKNR